MKKIEKAADFNYLHIYGMWIEEILREKDNDLSHVERNSDKT